MGPPCLLAAGASSTPAAQPIAVHLGNTYGSANLVSAGGSTHARRPGLLGVAAASGLSGGITPLRARPEGESAETGHVPPG